MSTPTTSSAPASAFRAVDASELPDAANAPLLDGRLADLLGGKKILMTGVTGFIGEQLLWKILTELPDTQVGVLVRRKGSASAHDRVKSLVKKKIFAEVRDHFGGAEELMAARIDVVEGDLPGVPELPRDLDIVVHCAGDVSFDPPIDQAFRTNTVGTKALMTRMLEAVTDADGNLTKIPHYVHVSTAYTAGRRRGAIPEAIHAHDIDYEAETAAGLAMREQLEAESRTSESLTRFRKEAERDHRQAGFLTTAADTEKRRKDWIQTKLIEAGTERARSLGWTDVYTFTKALGERVVAEVGKDIRVSVVRPAIVESSWKHPYPGWIEGFKMAEPLILAYGKGNLPEFPASPDAVVDIIPCDFVVNGIVAVCATEPPVGEPWFYHLNSGARNPLTFQAIYTHIRTYFLAHPFMDKQGQPIEVPEWDFPGAAAVERRLAATERAHALAERLIRYAPRSGWTRTVAKGMDKTQQRLDFLRRHLSLYNEYAQSELHFVDDNTLRLNNSLDPADVDAFAFDSAVYDWATYVNEVHVPSVTAPVRRLDALKRKRGRRPSTFKALKKQTDPQTKVLAAFDLDGTVMSGNVIETYLWTKLPGVDPLGQLTEMVSLLGRLPSYLHAERRDRGTFLRAFYRRYKGFNMAELERFIDAEVAPWIMDKVSDDAIQRLREHREAGHTTILLTGAIRPLTRPLADLFDVIIAADLEVDAKGVATGFLTGPPMVGESRSAWLAHYARLHGADLSKSFAYADSHVDLPMLSAVGSPVAVSPDVALMRAANAHQWTVVQWPALPKKPRWQLPTRR